MKSHFPTSLISSLKIAYPAILMATALFLGACLPKQITLSKTDSLDKHLFWRIDLNEQQKENLKTGQYVRFPFQEAGIEGGKKLMFLKQVGCAPGDMLRVEWPNYYCNDTLIAIGNATNSKGLPVRKYEYNGKIPAGQYFVKGNHKFSYDSRVWGLLDKATIIERAIPLL